MARAIWVGYAWVLRGSYFRYSSLKILHLIARESIRTGGSRQLERLVIELTRRGHEVIAGFADNPQFRGDFARLAESPVDLRFLKLAPFKPTAACLAAIKAIRQLLIEERPDIVHVHKGAMLDLMTFAGMGLDINIVANRGMTAPLNAINSVKYRRPKVKRIIAVAQAVKDVLVETGRIDPAKIPVVYGSVDTEVFHPGVEPTLRLEMAIDANQEVVGYLGSASARKGLNYLFDSMVMIARERPQVRFVLVGVDEKRLNQRGFPIPDEIRDRLTIFAFREDVANCMASFNVLLFSGIRNEGLTGTLREACAVGTPVVTSDVGGNAELIVDNKRGGRVTPIGDAAAMAQACCDLLEEPAHAAELGRRGHEWVSEHMNAKIRADRIEQVYADVLGETVGS